MTYLLDTNTCLFRINQKPRQVLGRLQQAFDLGVCLSSITVAELQFGVCNSQHYEKNRMALTEFLAPFDMVAFDDRDAEVFGLIRARLKKEGTLIGPYDMLIAAQALARDLVLVTNNTKEFCRVEGLKIEDWKG